MGSVPGGCARSTESDAGSSSSSTPGWLASSASAKRRVAIALIPRFSSSLAKVTSATLPCGRRSSRGGTWAYFEAQAESSRAPQTAMAHRTTVERLALDTGI
jgi:hypothetical protein